MISTVSMGLFEIIVPQILLRCMNTDFIIVHFIPDTKNEIELMNFEIKPENFFEPIKYNTIK